MHEVAGATKYEAIRPSYCRNTDTGKDETDTGKDDVKVNY